MRPNQAEQQHEREPMDGRYQIIRELGSGGMARVYLTRLAGAAGFEKLVALKRIRPELSSDKESVEMFLREARVAAQLNHPNVVQVFDAGLDGNDLYLVLEYVEGGDLDKLVMNLRKQRRRPTPAAVALVGSQMCEALTCLFSLRDEAGQRVVQAHRDISAGNILVSKSGVIKLGDFGVVRLRQSKTAFGTVRGKWEYLPPEIIRGVHDERGDIFALGITLYRLAALQHPFHAATSPAHLQRACRDEPTPLTFLPDKLWAILYRALQKDPALRYQTAEEMGEALDDFLCTSQERMSPRRLAKQLFAESAAAAGITVGSSRPNTNGNGNGAAVGHGSNGDVPQEVVSSTSPTMQGELDGMLDERPVSSKTLTPENEADEVKRFEELFGPSNEPVSVSSGNTPVNGPTASGSNHDLTELYNRFCQLRIQQHMPGQPIAMNKFIDSLKTRRQALLQQHPNYTVRFELSIQQGLPVVRPRLVARDEQEAQLDG
jgi:serine/threonine protein kinase